MVAGYLISWIPGFDPNVYGLVPRTFGGLFGIATMPFLHAGLGHLLANLSSLVVLLGFLLVFHSNKAFEVVLEVILLGGILLWLFGRSALHVGASGLVYGLAGYLIAVGFAQKRFLELIASVIVAFLYGTSLVWGLLPIRPGISWDGHLAGLIAGIAIGIWGETRAPRAANPPDQFPRLSLD
ncbi:MAG TPA: rhomboid family intramembrane serine protease [Planctomycetaceae bacterium]|nr:rhomboid family intramembrane serine protease [Planctomycetaceae bacterium]